MQLHSVLTAIQQPESRAPQNPRDQMLKDEDQKDSKPSFIRVKVLSMLEERNNLCEEEVIHCRFRNGYIVTTNLFVMTTVECYYR